MSATAAIDTPPTHRIEDWLSMHGVTADACARLVRSIPTPPPVPVAPSTMYPPPELAVAQAIAHRALRRMLPVHAAVIDDTLDRTELVCLDRAVARGRAVTIDKGGGTFPTILLSYVGEPGDLLILAHEYGHALQLRMSEGRFVAPVARELCAFLAERALLIEAGIDDPLLHGHLSRASAEDDLRYFGSDRDRLLNALTRPGATYRYTWNYPIARYVARRIDRADQAEILPALFRGRLRPVELMSIG